MPKLIKFSFCLIGCIYCFTKASAQTVKEDSLLVSAVKNSVNWYKESVKENSRLYNGSEYNRYGHGFEGHPFFSTDQMQKGDVLYDGVLYRDVEMLYDLVMDCLVINDYYGNYNMRLVSEKVAYFSLEGHEFIWIEADSTRGALIGTGFYERLYNNGLQVLVRHEKKIERPSRNDEKTKVTPYDFYFIKKSDRYYKIDSERNLLNVFSEKKNEVRRFLNKDKIHFRKDRQHAIVSAANYYAQLMNP